MPDKDWSFHVHDDGLYASINDGLDGDTFLRIGGQPGPPGHIDQAKVEEFAEDYKQRLPLQVIRERLTDKKIATAAAKAEFESVESYKWSSCSPSEKDEWRAGYLRAIEAALDAAFSKEEDG
jgi:hypothetical protein